MSKEYEAYAIVTSSPEYSIPIMTTGKVEKTGITLEPWAIFREKKEAERLRREGQKRTHCKLSVKKVTVTIHD